MVTNRSAPTATIVPILIYEDVGRAIEWLCEAFGFSEHLRAERDGIIGHAQLAVAEGAIMLGRQGGPYRVPHGDGDEVSQYVHVAIADVDRHFEHSKQSGARVVQEPTTCRLACDSTQSRTTLDIGGRFPRIWPMLPQKNGARSRQEPKAQSNPAQGRRTQAARRDFLRG